VALADPNELWPELEQIGEEEVRRRLLLNTYGHTKLPSVQAWLERKEGDRRAKLGEHDQAQRRQELAILRSTKNAAWVAAGAAVASALFAVLAFWYAGK
jgi:hypothetical protein